MLRLEPLEQREMLTDYTISAVADGSPDTFRLVKSGTSIQAYVNGSPTPTSTFALSSLGATGKITVTGSNDADTLTVDSSGGLLAGFGGIVFNAGSGTDQLILSGGTATSEVHDVGAGTNVITNASTTQAVTFTGIESTLSTIPLTSSLTVNGTSSSEAITYQQGTTSANGKVTVGSYAPIEFSNKTSLTINGVGGSDTVDLNNSSKPTGLTGSITIDSIPALTSLPSGAALWLDASKLNLANGATVATLSDLSGNNNIAVAGNYGLTGSVTYNANSLNGKGTIHFNDFGNLTTINNLGISGDADRSIFMVMRRNVPSPEGWARMSFQTGAAWGNAFMLDDAAALTFGFWEDGGGIELAPRPAGTFEVFGMTHNSATSDSILYANGTELLTRNQILNTANGPAIVGSFTPSWDFCHENGDFAEALVYNRLLTDTERGQVENYLNAKWFQTPAAAEIALTVNSQLGVADSMRLEPTASGAGTISYVLPNGSASTMPTVSFSSATSLAMVGQSADGDTFGVDGTRGGDTFHYAPGATSGTGSLSGTMDQNNLTGNGPFALAGVSFSGMSQASQNVFNYGSAADTGIRFGNVLPMGDSITNGDWAEGGYRTKLYTDIAGSGAPVTFIGNSTNNPSATLTAAGQTHHEGHSGWRIDQLDANLSSWLSTIANPDYILLLIGTNDFWQGNDISNAIHRLDTLITHIVAARPNAQLLVSNLTLRTDNATWESQIETLFNPFVPGIVANHAALGQNVSFVDMHSVITALDLIDQLHPNQTGYDKMADAWFAAMQACTDSFVYDASEAADTISVTPGTGGTTILGTADSAVVANLQISNTTSLVINANGGNDTVNLNKNAACATTVNGGSGTDTLNAYYTVPGTVNTSGPDTITGFGSTVTYTGIESVNIAAFSTDHTINAAGTGGNGMNNAVADAFRLVLNPAKTDVDVYLNETFSQSIPLSSLNRITVAGSNDNDTLTIDDTNGLIALPGGIAFNGGSGTNGLILSGGSTNVDEVYDTEACTDTITDASNNRQIVTFTGIGSALSTVPVTSLVVSGTSAANAINYLQGSSAPYGKVAVDAYAAIEFAGKSSLNIVGGAGADTISLNNPTTSSGLISVVVNGAMVNQSPTLNPISDPAAINQNVGTQTVSLSGIAAGPGDTQTLQVTATSDNTGLIPNPTVTYTSPNTAGSIAYTPVAYKYGTAHVTVTVRDAGSDGTPGNGDDATFSRNFAVVVKELPVASVTLWLDSSKLTLANGATVTTLNDLSGNNNTAVAGNYGSTGTATYNASSLNGKGTIHFSDFANLTTVNNLGISGDADRSIFVVTRRNSGDRSRMSFLTGSPWGNTFALDNAGGLNFGLWNDGGDNIAASRPVDTFEIIGATHNGVTADSIVYVNGQVVPTRLYVNDEPVGPPLMAVNRVLNTMDGPAIVGSFTPAYGFCRENGDFAEALVYNRLLSNAERIAVEQYLTNKWFVVGGAGAAEAGPAAAIPGTGDLVVDTSGSSPDADILIINGRPGTNDAITVTSTADNAGSANYNTSGAPNVTFSAVKGLTLSGQLSESDVYSVGGTNLGQGQDTLTLNIAKLQLGAGHVLASAVDVTITGTGTLDLGGQTVTVDDLLLTSGSLLNGTLIGSSLTVESGTVAATLQSTAGLTKSGTGTTTLSAANTYTGDTVVSGGQLNVSADNALPANTTLVIGSEGTVVLNSSLTKAVRLKRLVMILDSGTAVPQAAPIATTSMSAPAEPISAQPDQPTTPAIPSLTATSLNWGPKAESRTRLLTASPSAKAHDAAIPSVVQRPSASLLGWLWEQVGLGKTQSTPKKRDPDVITVDTVLAQYSR